MRRKVITVLLLTLLLAALTACGTGTTGTNSSSSFVPDNKVQPTPIYANHVLVGVITIGLENDTIQNTNGSTSFTSQLQAFFTPVGGYHLESSQYVNVQVGSESAFAVYSANNNNPLGSPDLWVKFVVQDDHTIQYTVS